MKSENQHPIGEVARLQWLVDLIIKVFDLDHERASTPLSASVTELYRVAFVRCGAPPAIDSILSWAHAHLQSELPRGFGADLDAVKSFLQEADTGAAAAALNAAAGDLVTEVRPGLTMHQAACVACLSSMLTMTAELISIHGSFDIGEQPDDPWFLLESTATEDDLVEILAQAVRFRRDDFGDLYMLSPRTVREALRDAPQAHHPRMILLLWAVESGALVRLGGRIKSRLAELTQESEEFRKGWGEAATC